MDEKLAQLTGLIDVDGVTISGVRLEMFVCDQVWPVHWHTRPELTRVTFTAGKRQVQVVGDGLSFDVTVLVEGRLPNVKGGLLFDQVVDYVKEVCRV